MEPEGVAAKPALDQIFEADKGPAADEQDLLGVDLNVFLLRVLASALRRDIADGAFKDLEQRLLDAFARDIAGDGNIFGLAPDLVDFIDVDDAALGAGDIEVRGLEQAQDDVLDILADVAGFG